MSASDEFDEFDLSEFTPEEFTLIDTNISHMLTSVTQTAAKPASSAAPAVEIVLESEADTEPSPKAHDLVSGVFQSATKDSPYARLSSRKKSFAVTELVFPLWYVGGSTVIFESHSISFQGVRFNMNMDSGARVTDDLICDQRFSRPGVARRYVSNATELLPVTADLSVAK